MYHTNLLHNIFDALTYCHPPRMRPHVSQFTSFTSSCAVAATAMDISARSSLIVLPLGQNRSNALQLPGYQVISNANQFRIPLKRRTILSWSTSSPQSRTGRSVIRLGRLCFQMENIRSHYTRNTRNTQISCLVDMFPQSPLVNATERALRIVNGVFFLQMFFSRLFFILFVLSLHKLIEYEGSSSRWNNIAIIGGKEPNSKLPPEKKYICTG